MAHRTPTHDFPPVIAVEEEGQTTFLIPIGGGQETFYILQETGGDTDRLLLEGGTDLLVTEASTPAVGNAYTSFRRSGHR